MSQSSLYSVQLNGSVRRANRLIVKNLGQNNYKKRREYDRSAMHLNYISIHRLGPKSFAYTINARSMPFFKGCSRGKASTYEKCFADAISQFV